MWLVFALLAPICFAIVAVLDAYCVEDVFEEPWMGAVTSAIATLIIIFSPLPLILPFVEIQIPSPSVFIACFLAGALIQFSQILYFKSLSYSEAGIVSAYWNFIPIFLPILSIIFFQEILSLKEYLGILTLVFASTYMLTLDAHIDTRFTSFSLMALASFMQAIAYLLLDYGNSAGNYFECFFIMTLGLVLAGCTPLILKKTRMLLRKNYFVLVSAKKLFLGIELVNVLALASAQRAIALGNPSLVAAIETTIPAFAFIFGILLVYALPTVGEAEAKKNILKKLASVIVMCMGVWLLS